VRSAAVLGERIVGGVSVAGLAPFDAEGLDHAALSRKWSWLGKVVGSAIEAGPGGLIDDDLAYVAPWECDLANTTAPTLLLTVAATESSRARTAGASRATAPLRSCGCRRTTDTSRFSARPRRLWSGSARKLGVLEAR
jgi:hypothetical protein